MVTINCLGEQIGVEVTGVDLRALDDAEFRSLYQVWLEYNVLVVRDQELTIDEFLRYSRRFGRIVPHPSSTTRHPDCPEVTLLGTGKFDADGNVIEAIYRRGAEGWHTDGSYCANPFKATQLHSIAVPSIGGDTFFASMYAAYDALPQRLKQRLEGVRAVCIYGGRRQLGMGLLNEEDRQGWRPVLHEIARLHPETGRTALYFDPGKILSIEGATKRESDDLIEELIGYMIQPSSVYRHHWRLGDVVIWDNRCSYHKAAGDYPPHEDRIHWRVSIEDDVSAATV